jgi:uncharacterized membrane protein
MEFREGVELAARSVEALAVLIMVAVIIVGTLRWLVHSGRRVAAAYARYRVVLGKALLIGLELLVAADIIRTVALETTLVDIATLGALVIVRTFLGWTITVEVEGRWPWQGAVETDAGRALREPRA